MNRPHRPRPTNAVLRAADIASEILTRMQVTGERNASAGLNEITDALQEVTDGVERLHVTPSTPARSKAK